MLTGEYAWRQKGTGILPGDAPLIIEPGRVTLASMLHDAGYATGVVGKWHLGLGRGRPDWNGEIKPGPLEIGFDYCFIIPATGDRVPCVYRREPSRRRPRSGRSDSRSAIRAKVGNEPTGAERPDLLTIKTTPGHGHDNTIVNGISRIGYMTGGKAARWHDEDMADTLTQQAVEFIKRNRDKPFFLYFATHDIHVPRVPHPRFRGATKMGPRGDVIVEFDWSAGQVLHALDELEPDGQHARHFHAATTARWWTTATWTTPSKSSASHKPAGPLRGGKSTVFEGGTRVPFIVRWPKHVPAGSTSDALVCQIDLLASLAALTNQKLPNHAAPDSVNVLPALLGESETGPRQPGRAGPNRSRCGKEIGNTSNQRRSGSRGSMPRPQLYNLADDLAEHVQPRQAAPGEGERTFQAARRHPQIGPDAVTCTSALPAAYSRMSARSPTTRMSVPSSTRDFPSRPIKAKIAS